MNIFILDCDKRFRPKSQLFRYPSHNRDYGVEQDFYAYLREAGRSLVVSDPSKAEWHYLPVYWTRWHLNHDYGKKGIDELQTEVGRCIIDDAKTFTICQYDDGPLVNIGRTTQFLASRRTTRGIDIPLLSSPHRKPLFPVKKKYLASFVGRIATHPIRGTMLAALHERDDVLIDDSDRGARHFVRTLLSSYIALCPRGYGGNSFRFYEAMQLGVVPFLIGDADTRPFKNHINWDDCSFYSSRVEDIIEILQQYDKTELRKMAVQANRLYNDKIKYGKWCQYVLQELKDLL